ncbi:hypothetical protein PVK06_012111 [Gossypium arboreum]|uniref:Uncharacterized protein n=1 Tax=Gossypium arboreum TaxID=29729 RepID=A0ABR0QB98_GOSAR|nr:hypothetical protein PVK06_012111 [Gossypium arboreum]
MEERSSVSWNAAVVGSSRRQRILPAAVEAIGHHQSSRRQHSDLSQAFALQCMIS